MYLSEKAMNHIVKNLNPNNNLSSHIYIYIWVQVTLDVTSLELQHF